MGDYIKCVIQEIETRMKMCELAGESLYPITTDAMKVILDLLKKLVPCSECIRRGTYDCPIYVGGDAGHGSPDDWFCADGKRRE